MSKMIPAGIVTAYGAAVRGGYPGTYEDFCAALGGLTKVLEEFEGFQVEVTTLEAGESATADYSDGVLTLGIPAGETGNGIQDAVLNDDYTLTLTWTNGESDTVGPIRGATGKTPDFEIGTVQTLQPDQPASASITGTPEHPVLNLAIPKGDPGQDGASDAGDVTFDPEEDYDEGTVGKALKDELNAIGQKADKTTYVTLSGTQVTQVGADNTMYLCGELTELTFTAPQTGITAVRFTSGTTPTVVTLNGVTMPDDWAGAEASTIYEINVLNGLGVWQAWT